ncbi:hypothetical protein CEXT_96431, partial [Caerostris extrusa]
MATCAHHCVGPIPRLYYRVRKMYDHYTPWLYMGISLDIPPSTLPQSSLLTSFPSTDLH